MTRGMGLEHIGLYVRGLERMAAFYRDVLGRRRSSSRCGLLFTRKRFEAPRSLSVGPWTAA
jgi:catechol 2,3-dioxygenase-like lactoylglutathione lyase family enzyme